MSSDISDIKDLAIVCGVGYIAYKFFGPNQIVEKAGEVIYKVGEKTGEIIGRTTSELQKQWYMTEFEAQNIFNKPIEAVTEYVGKPTINYLADTEVFQEREKSIVLQIAENMAKTIYPPLTFAWTGALSLAKKLWGAG